MSTNAERWAAGIRDPAPKEPAPNPNNHLLILLAELLGNIDQQIGEIKFEAAKKGVPLAKLRLPDGRWVMIDLYCAKAQVLHSLTMLGGST
jgi:hypothetical protein